MMIARAAGSCTLHIVCQRVAPSASDASLRARGTERRPSALRVAIVGTIMIESTTPAARTPEPCLPGGATRSRMGSRAMKPR